MAFETTKEEIYQNIKNMILIERKEIIKRFRRLKVKWFFLGVMFAIIPFIVFGYWWSYQVNIKDVTDKNLKIKALNEELKKHYQPIPLPKPGKTIKKSD